jgi:peptide/nickel transport system substrate-binding protein
MRSLVILISLLVIASLIAGCITNISSTTVTPTPTNTSHSSTPIPASAPATSMSKPTSSIAQSTAVSPSNPSVNEPTYGGVFRVMVGGGPMVLGGIELGANDTVFVTPAVERLLNTTPERKQGADLENILAEKVEEDITNKRIVFHIRPGIKFHDGSDLNADVVVWNFQRMAQAGCLQYMGNWDGVKKLDDMTVQVNYKAYSNQLIESWGMLAITSKTAFETGSGGDPQKGLEWDRVHCVGTGPFILKEYLRDDHLTWVKNPNYWRKGKPYLDAIEFQIIPDSTVSLTLLLAGGADYWIGAAGNPRNYTGLINKGFQVISYTLGSMSGIWPNTSNPESKWNDGRLRQALEYAIDKPTMAKAWGPGFFVPLTMLAPSGEWGYDPNYPARNYDPKKARGLIIEAGYTPPLRAQLLLPNDWATTMVATTLKQYLDAAGFLINLDVADYGRYSSAFYGRPGPDLALGIAVRTDSSYLKTYMAWFSTEPLADFAYLGHTSEQKAMDEIATKVPDMAGQKAITEKLIRNMTDEARVIPLLWSTLNHFAASYVHAVPYLGIRWYTEDIWMEKH